MPGRETHPSVIPDVAAREKRIVAAFLESGLSVSALARQHRLTFHRVASILDRHGIARPRKRSARHA
jgi:transposase-like protein